MIFVCVNQLKTLRKLFPILLRVKSQLFQDVFNREILTESISREKSTIKHLICKLIHSRVKQIRKWFPEIENSCKQNKLESKLKLFSKNSQIGNLYA